MARDNPVAAQPWVECLWSGPSKQRLPHTRAAWAPNCNERLSGKCSLRTYHVREQAIDALTVFEGHRRLDTTDLPALGQ